jgi:protein-tyrosine-phosphatase
VRTAGTLVVEGQPMSWRTRAALESVGVAVPDHRSRQATAADLSHADLVIALAPEHVHWVRRTHPAAAGRTGTLRRVVRDLAHDDRPLPERVAELRLADVELEAWEEVVDPGGGDAEAFAACARDVHALIEALADRLAHR